MCVRLHQAMCVRLHQAMCVRLHQAMDVLYAAPFHLLITVHDSHSTFEHIPIPPFLIILHSTLLLITFSFHFLITLHSTSMINTPIPLSLTRSQTWNLLSTESTKRSSLIIMPMSSPHTIWSSLHPATRRGRHLVLLQLYRPTNDGLLCKDKGGVRHIL